MSSPELWVVALLRWPLLCALAGAIGGIAGRALARGQAAPGPAALPGPGALRASLLGLAASAGLAIEILGDNRLAAALTHRSLSRLLHTGDGRDRRRRARLIRPWRPYLRAGYADPG